MSRAFTLIELLIVIGVVAILSVAVVLALNPTQLMAQGRDTTRMHDLDTMHHALTLYGAEQANFGKPNTLYVSVPDTSLAPGATSTCQGIGLSTTTLPAGWTYQCVSSANLQKADGTGWLPANFSLMTSKPLSQLPLDPMNTTSSGNYYTYVTNGSQWELTSIAESQKYKSQSNSKTSFQPGLLAQGSNLTLSPIFNSSGLVGYWPMDEGTGTTAADLSGNNYGLTWAGGSAYSTGKVGAYAGNFNTNYLVGNPPQITGPLTMTAWVNSKNAAGDIMGYTGYHPTWGYSFIINTNLGLNFQDSGSTWRSQGSTVAVPLNAWQHVAVTYDQSNLKYYLNGALQQTIPWTYSAANVTSTFQLGMVGWIQFVGSIDDARLYNRALTASEIQALYNATK